VPDVLAAGGVFLDQNGALHGSDYASGYKSPLVRSRNRAHGVWLSRGMQPRAQYLMP
jgi:hypothetical protein